MRSWFVIFVLLIALRLGRAGIEVLGNESAVRISSNEGKTWKPFSKAKGVHFGDALKTGETGMIQLRMDAGILMRFDSNTVALIEKRNNHGTNFVEVRLNVGRCVIAKRGTTNELAIAVLTPLAVSFATQSAEFVVSSEGISECLSGKIKVSDLLDYKGDADVGAGERIRPTRSRENPKNGIEPIKDEERARLREELDQLAHAARSISKVNKTKI